MATYKNPVRRGFFPDPSVVRVGDDYYMVNSSFQYFPAIPISHSRDMIHWRIAGHAVTENKYLDLSSIPDSHGIWAPDISYHDGLFYIFATLRLPGSLPAGDGVKNGRVLRRQLMVTAADPAGPWSAPAWLEVDDIDPSHFVDDDGTHYMIIAPGVRAVRLSDDCRTVLSGPRTVWAGTGAGHEEGPHLMKKDGWYYAILAEGGTGYGHRITVARSRQLFGEYEPSPYNPVLQQHDATALIQRTGHGKLVCTQNGDWWVFYLCSRQNGGQYTTIGRESALDPVHFTPDGWFAVNHGKGPSLENDAPRLPSVVFEEKSRDDFDMPVLDKRWEFVRNPFDGAWSLTERPGFLRLWTCDGLLGEIQARNTLVRREEELSFDASTCLEFSPARDGEQAGLVSYYGIVNYLRWSLCFHSGRRVLRLVANKGYGEELVAEVRDVPAKPVFLKEEARGQRRTFSYSYDGQEWTTVAEVKTTFLSDEGVPSGHKHHTGTLTGIYANNGGRGSRIPADFDWFEIVAL